MRFLAPITVLLFGCVVMLGGAGVYQPAEVVAQSQRRTTIAKILSERDLEKANRKNPRYCQGGVFKPCVCAKDVTKLAQYRPSVSECNGNAAVILSGRYTSAFSAVVRDRENKDRWPPQGLNGCTDYERDILALKKCSAFKAHEVIPVENEEGDAKVHCLGASGYSPLFSRVSRITIKLADSPDSTNDPVARLCLNGPREPLN